MNKSSAKRVTPMSFTQQTTSPHLRVPSVSPMSSVTPIPSDANLFSLPKLITYDIFERKSVQQLLYESAQERDNAEHKWKKFNSELERHLNAKQYSKHLIKTLDDTKQWAALHYAVFNNNRYVCDQLTDKKSGDKRFRCDINILTGNGENVLHIAARSSFLWETPSSMKSIENIVPVYGNPVQLPAIICTLIDRGANVNHADDEGRTPLHLAVMQNRLPFVKYLLTKKVNLCAATKLYFNVLHFTFIPNGQTQAQLSDMFEYIIEKLESSAREWHFPWKNQQTNLAQMHTVDNRTPLVLALAHPETNDSIIRRLLEYMKDYSEDFFYQSSSEKNIYQTQIFIAIEQVAKRQLYKRVIPSSSYHHLQKNSMESPTYDHIQPVCEVCNATTFSQLFHFPCRYNNVELLRWLIEQSSKFNSKTTPLKEPFEKYNLNTPDHAGYTPLLTAVFYGSTECVKHLLQYSISSAQTNTKTPSLSVKIDQTNTDNENILHICTKHSVPKELFETIWNPAVTFRLLENPDNKGNLPLHVAAGNNQRDMCNKFLTAFEWSFDPLSKRNNQGQTAAHVAILSVPHRIGPERHFVEKHEIGKTHDHKAGKEKKTDDDDDDDDSYDFGLPIIESLWEITRTNGRHGGLFERDGDQKTCLHLAAENGHFKIVKFLVENVRFEIDPIADRRLTPLHLACENGHGEIIAYLIEHGASPTLRNAELYNALEIAIVNQNKKVVEELLTLPNWRELMSNAQRLDDSEGYDTPMRKLIRYLPKIAVWLIETKLTRTLGGQGKYVFKTVYDYEFYMDVYRVKQWYKQDARALHEDESFSERCHRRGCAAICYCNCCCRPHFNEKMNDQTPYTDDAYTLIRNHPLFIASEQSQCPALVEHPYNLFLRARWFRQNGRFFYFIRAFSFILYAAFLALWTAIILSSKHPQYFYAKLGRNMTLDLDSCANVSRILTNTNDSEALKTTTYKNLRYSLYALLMLFVVENVILIFTLFPRIFRTIDYILEISAFALTFVYIYDWADWQNPLIFRCPVQYQIGSMGLLLAWLSMLTYVKRTTWFDMGVFVVMIQLIGFKFMRFIPVLLIIVCGFGFTHWMLLQNQDPFQSPVEAVIRTGLLMFDLGYEDHLYNNPIYYEIIYFITILSAIVFCIFILNLLISVAVGEIPSLTVQGKIWQSQMLYDLLSDYSIISLQLIRFINRITCGSLGRWIFKQRLQPIFILEQDLTGNWQENAWKYVQKNFFEEKIQDDIIPNKTSGDTKNDDK